jgi:hypothetical protein
MLTPSPKRKGERRREGVAALFGLAVITSVGIVFVHLPQPGGAQTTVWMHALFEHVDPDGCRALTGASRPSLPKGEIRGALL